MLIFTFDVMVNNSVVAEVLPPKLPSKEDDDIHSMPLLKLESCDCNCTSFPNVSDVLLEEGDGNDARVDQDVQDQIEKNQEEIKASTNNVCESTRSTSLFSETYALKGSTFHNVREYFVAANRCFWKTFQLS